MNGQRRAYSESGPIHWRVSRGRLIPLRGGVPKWVIEDRIENNREDREAHPETVDAFAEFFKRALPYVIDYGKRVMKNKRAAKWIKWFFRHITRKTDLEDAHRFNVENPEKEKALTEYFNSEERMSREAVGEVMEVFPGVVENLVLRFSKIDYFYLGRLDDNMLTAMNFSLYIYCQGKALQIAALKLHENITLKETDWKWDKAGMPQEVILRCSDRLTDTKVTYLQMDVDSFSFHNNDYAVILKQRQLEPESREYYRVILKIKWANPTDEVCTYYQEADEHARSSNIIHKTKIFISNTVKKTIGQGSRKKSSGENASTSDEDDDNKAGPSIIEASTE